MPRSKTLFAIKIERKQQRKRASDALYKRRKRTSDALYARSLKLHVPSAKLNKNWRECYTSAFQQMWDSLYSSILKQETKPKSTSGIKGKRRRSRKSDGNGEYIQFLRKRYLLNTFCESLQFGIMNLTHKQRKNKRKESDILSFYFTVRFTTSYNKTYLLYLKYISDDLCMKKKRNPLLGDDEIRTKSVQITCDFSYAEINGIINKKYGNTALSSDILAEIFEYVKPSKYLVLFSSKTEESADCFDTVDKDPFDKNNFKSSNIEWVANFFGLESWHFMKLFKVLMIFLDTEEVLNYIKKEKDYDKKWEELVEAQRDLY